MTGARRWLGTHLGDAPAPLLRTMLDALPAEEMPVQEALAGAALALYERVLAGSGAREDALPLLAADALLTHAIEVQAEEDPQALAGFLERWGAAGHLAELIHRAEP